jgi:hypothetical protein
MGNSESVKREDAYGSRQSHKKEEAETSKPRRTPRIIATDQEISRKGAKAQRDFAEDDWEEDQEGGENTAFS